MLKALRGWNVATLAKVGCRRWDRFETVAHCLSQTFLQLWRPMIYSLRNQFREADTVFEVFVSRNKSSGKSNGFGFFFFDSRPNGMQIKPLNCWTDDEEDDGRFLFKWRSTLTMRIDPRRLWGVRTATVYSVMVVNSVWTRTIYSVHVCPNHRLKDVFQIRSQQLSISKSLFKVNMYTFY